jgi:hypothetical protein
MLWPSVSLHHDQSLFPISGADNLSWSRDFEPMFLLNTDIITGMPASAGVMFVMFVLFARRLSRALPGLQIRSLESDPILALFS